MTLRSANGSAAGIRYARYAQTGSPAIHIDQIIQ
jgi:hypothetical protein